MDEDVMKAIKPTENRLAVDRSSAAPTSIKPVRDPRLQWLLRLSPWAMLAALPVLLGVQLLLGFLNHDMQNAPRHVIHRRLEPPR